MEILVGFGLALGLSVGFAVVGFTVIALSRKISKK
jgi:hypothetical protein